MLESAFHLNVHALVSQVLHPSHDRISPSSMSNLTPIVEEIIGGQKYHQFVQANPVFSDL